MRKLLARVDRIRASGWVRLDLKEDHPLFGLDGRRYEVESIGVPDYKCRVSVWINGVKTDFTIDEVS
jgi:hypothetical protein